MSSTIRLLLASLVCALFGIAAPATAATSDDTASPAKAAHAAATVLAQALTPKERQQQKRKNAKKKQGNAAKHPPKKKAQPKKANKKRPTAGRARQEALKSKKSKKSKAIQQNQKRKKAQQKKRAVEKRQNALNARKKKQERLKENRKENRERAEKRHERLQERARNQRERAKDARKEKRQLQAKRAEHAKQVRRRRAIKRREAKRDARQFKKLEQRRVALRRKIKADRNRSQRLKRQNRRLARQRDWLATQRRVHRRRVHRDFVFRERARIYERRRDRTIFAALAGAAVGAAVVGSYYVYHNDDSRIDWRAQDVYVDDLDNGWTRSVVIRPSGLRVVTIRDSGGFIVRRYRVYPGNRVVMLYDNQPRWWDDGDLVVDVAPVRYSGPRNRYIVEPSSADVETVYETIVADPVADIDRTYTLNQILVNANLRGYMPRIDLDTINFPTGSSEIPEDQYDKLEAVGTAMEQAIKENPDEVYLIEGYTDAVGDKVDNLTLSDERAAAVANILTEYFEIPPENLVTQGYGEDFLKYETDGPDPRNRRVAIRRITPLLANENDDVAFDSDGNVVFE